MEHWRKVVPAGVMLEVQYEDVVDDLEGQARRIVAHCGLEPALPFTRRNGSCRRQAPSRCASRSINPRLGDGIPYKDQLRPLLEALDIDK
jgi:hypothetical protein